MRMDLMKGVIDMHVHTNPDLRLRAYDDFELMEAAIRVGARAIVIKTHQGSTVDRAYLCNRHNEIVHGKMNDFTMFGGIFYLRQQSIPAWQIPGRNSEYPADHAGHGQAYGCGRLYYKEENRQLFYG